MDDIVLTPMEYQRHPVNRVLNAFCRVASSVTPWSWNYYWRRNATGRRRLVLGPDR